MKKWIQLLVLFVIAYIFLDTPVAITQLNYYRPECDMPLDLDATVGQYVAFGSPAYLDDIAQKTLMFRFNLDSLPSGTTHRIWDKGNVTGNGWAIDMIDGGGSALLRYIQTWSSINGLWQTDSGFISVGTDNHFAVKYDLGSTSNDPEFFLNGVSINVTETSAPSGTVSVDAANIWGLGTVHASGRPIDGKLWDVGAYNYLMSDNDIKSIALGKTGMQEYSGLLWYCDFLGAKGMQAPGVVSAANTFYDRMKGLVGTPNNSPSLAGDVYMAYP